MLHAIGICDVAFQAFFEDTRQLVALGVRKDISQRIASAPSRQRLEEEKSSGERREAYLKAWLKEDHPLAYGPQGTNETYTSLVQAVVHDEGTHSYGLPNWTENASTPYNFATLLANISAPANPASPMAPVLKTGTFLPVLKIAHKALISLYNSQDREARRNFVLDTFCTALKIFKVQFFPAPKPKSRTAGAPNRVPVFNSWGNLGARDTHRPTPVAGPSTRQPVRPTTVAFNNAIANDCNADWTAGSVNIRTLKNFLNKTTLPTDFATPSLTDIAYVDETYSWVRCNYDGTKPLHHLALLVSIVVASSLLPNLFLPPDAKNLLRGAPTVEDVRRVYGNMEWLPKHGRRGMSEKSVFVAMFMTFIIALYEPESPLRKHIQAAPKSGLGDSWTKKHCELPLLLFLSPCLPLFLILLFILSSRKGRHLRQHHPSRTLVG